MSYNSGIPGVATDQRARAQVAETMVCRELVDALTFVRRACVPGEYSETALPAQIWALDKAAAALAVYDDHLRPPVEPRTKAARATGLSAVAAAEQHRLEVTR